MNSDICIQRNVNLADKNWFGTGGKAEFFAEPVTVEQMIFCLQWARDNNQTITCIGLGANILIADTGISGLVIRPAFRLITAVDDNNTDVLVSVGSGYSMHNLIDWCFENNIIGLHEFSGIPSSVGGAIYINLHFFQFLIEQFVVSAIIIDKDGTILTVDRTWFLFKYNYSRLHEKEYYLVEVTFRLLKVDSKTVAYHKGRADEIKRYRAHRYPTKNTCGSFFRNFLPDEVSLEINGKKAIWAAYYLDQVGVKGAVKYGGAIVSFQHANMIVADPVLNPTSADIIACARECQKRVFDEYCLILVPECEFFGFSDYPLLLKS